MPDQIITFGASLDPSQLVAGTEQGNRALDRLQQTSKRMDTGFAQLTRGATAAGTSFKGVERSVVTAGFALAGVQGPLGIVGRQLLIFGAGGPVALGAAAGIGAIALAMKFLSADAEEATKRLDKLLAAARGLQQNAIGTAIVQRGEAGEAVRTQEARLAALRARIERFGPEAGGPKDIEKAEAKLGELRSALQTFEARLTLLRAQRDEDLAQTMDALINVGVEARIKDAREQRVREALTPSVIGASVLPGTFGSRLVRSEDAPLARLEKANLEGLGAVVERLNFVVRIGRIDVDRYADAIKASGEATKLFGMVAISTFSSLAQSLIRGDLGPGAAIGAASAGIGGLVSAGGGFLGAANPLLGAGIAAAGGIIGALFGGGKKEPLPVRDDGNRKAVEALQRKIEALEARRPKQVTNQFFGTGWTPESTRAAMAAARRQDALFESALTG